MNIEVYSAWCNKYKKMLKKSKINVKENLVMVVIIQNLLKKYYNGRLFTMKNKTVITILHKVTVDSCIAEELEELNNEKEIFTLGSCCGHGLEGHILVGGDDVSKMLDLGYELDICWLLTTCTFINKKMEQEYNHHVCSFRPKSKCICKTDIKELLDMGKKQVTVQLDEEKIKEMEKIRDETGMPISRLIDLKLRGYSIVKKDKGVSK